MKTSDIIILIMNLMLIYTQIQAQNIDQLNKDFKQLYQNGKYAEAVDKYTAMFIKAEKNSDKALVSKSLKIFTDHLINQRKAVTELTEKVNNLTNKVNSLTAELEAAKLEAAKQGKTEEAALLARIAQLEKELADAQRKIKELNEKMSNAKEIKQILSDTIQMIRVEIKKEQAEKQLVIQKNTELEQLLKIANERITALESQNVALQDKNAFYADRIYNLVNAFHFYDGKFALSYKDGKYGFVDSIGTVTIQHEFDTATPFDESTGYAEVTWKGARYLLDTTGRRYLIEPKPGDSKDSVEVVIIDNQPVSEDKINSRIKILAIKNTKLDRFPLARLEELDSLVDLDLSNTGITTLPNLDRMNDLRTLNLAGNPIKTLPEILPPNLEKLDLSNTSIKAPFEKIGNLTKLKVLYLNGTSLGVFPMGITKLHLLTDLDLSRCGISELPEEIEQLSNLRRLNVSFNLLTELPRSIGELSNLTDLNVAFNKLKELPEQKLTTLPNLRAFNYAGNRLTLPLLFNETVVVHKAGNLFDQKK